MALGKIKADTLEHSTAGTVDTQYVVNGSAKHFAVFDGTGTAAVDTSLNNSSLTDGGTGTYTLAVTNAFSSIHFAVTGATTGNNEAFNYIATSGSAKTASAVSFKCYQYDGSVNDTDTIDIVSHGDLA